MNAQSAQDLSPDELFQLMHFYAESGVEWLLDDEPRDRFADFVVQNAPRGRDDEVRQVETRAPASSALASRAQAKAPPPVSRPIVAIPDAEAAAEALRIAQAAGTLEALVTAVAGFTGCNLRNSARNTVFISGNPQARIAIAAGAPSADDDREGRPFAGPAGEMLAKMLAGIGLAVDDVLLFNLIPWRPAGNRAPTLHEVEICRPFGMRLLEIVRPKAVLALGNFPAKFFSGSMETIHGLRGRAMEVDVGGATAPVLATFHPQDLIAAPACKRLAWEDLLVFRQTLMV